MIKELESNIYRGKIKGIEIIAPGEGKTDGWVNNILQLFDQFFQWPAVLYLQEGQKQGKEP